MKCMQLGRELEMYFVGSRATMCVMDDGRGLLRPSNDNLSKSLYTSTMRKAIPKCNLRFQRCVKQFQNIMFCYRGRSIGAGNI